MRDREQRASWFHPHEGGDRAIDKASKAFDGVHGAVASIDFGLTNRQSKLPAVIKEAAVARALMQPQRYAFRSFDRQWIVPDRRLINRPNPALWKEHGVKQVYLTAPMDRTPIGGPGLTVTSLIPDLHHYWGRGGRVFALWKDAAGTDTNVAVEVLAAFALRFGTAPDPVDVFAYVAALLAHPGYTARFKADLIRPGLRVPLTAEKALFNEAATLGRQVIWLHSFGDRLPRGHPAGPPRLPVARRPIVPADGAIPNTPADFPETIGFDAAKQRLKVGKGHVDHVTQAMWDYEVSGKQVLVQWFSYRRKDRKKPIIGDRRPPSPLGDIQPDRWLPEYTEELLNVLNVLGLLIDLEPKQADVLQRIVAGPLITAAQVGGDGA